MTFEYPSIWFLSLLIVLPFFAWRMFTKRPAAINFSSTQAAKQLTPTWRMRLRWLLPLLRLAALTILIVALARPQFGRTQTSVDSEGIAIQMIVDRSGSMRAMDFKLDGRPVDRLTALKKVAGDFVQGGDGLAGRNNDLIGLITFARFADAASPLTLDHSFTVGKLNDTAIALNERENGTAIGDALGLATERLKALDESRKSDKQAAVKSKIIVLLTDGDNNAGDLDPADAAKLAEALGIRVYTIGVGTRGLAPVPQMNADGRMFMTTEEVQIDEESLTKIAESTGGKYFRATDTDSLKKIYEVIDQLEKTRVEEKRFTDYRELAVQPMREGGMSFPPLVLLSFALLASECLLAASVFRGIPETLNIMSEFIINNPLYVHLLWIVAAIVAVMAVALVFRRRAMARFATVNLHGKLAPQANSRRKWIKTLLLAASLAAMTAALLDVRWGRTWREVPQRGVDVMFVLDVSHSMLAQDATPNRLERAKQDILDIVQEMQGDRVGLVTFAGDTAQKSPLTSNYREFQLMLDEVGPHSVSRGGSDLGRAIEMAARGFIDKSANHKAIVIFSDGEDQDSKPIEAAKALHDKRGIRIFTVGLGDEAKGARIPTRTADGRQGWLQYKGQDVWTKMNGQVLQEVALAADGAYVPAGTKHVSMDQVYKQHIASIEEQQYEQARVNTYIPRYQWFVGLALLLAGLEVLLRDTRKIRMPKSIPVAISAVLAMLMIGAAPSPSYAAIASPTPTPVKAATPAPAPQPAPGANNVAHSEDATPVVEATPEATYNQAVDLYRAGKTDEAAAKWSEVVQSGKSDLEAKAHFNLGNCSYSAATKLREQQPEQAIGQLDNAIAHYRDSLKLSRGDQDARVNIELAARLREQIRQQEEQKKQQQQQQQQNQQQDQKKDQQKQDQQQQDRQQQKQDQQKQDQQKQDQQQQNQQQDQKQEQKNQDQQQNQQQQQDQQQQNQQDKQQEQNQQQDQKQQSQSQQKQDQKSDSKQDQQKSDQQQSAQQNQDQQQKSDEQKSDQQKQQQRDKQQSEQQKQQSQSQQDQSQQDQQKQDQSKTDQPKNDQSPEKQEQQKQEQQSKQQNEAQSRDQQSKDNHEQQQQAQSQPSKPPQKGDNLQQQSPRDQQDKDDRKKDEKTPDSFEPKPDEKQDKKPEPMSGQKLEANGSEKASEGTPMGEQSAAELKDGKSMTRDEAAKMLQAIRDRDLQRRYQQLRREQSQRRPVDKDW